MRTAVLLMVTAWVYGLYGLGLIFVPSEVIARFGGDVMGIGAFTSELYGSMMLGAAVMCWFAREAPRDAAFKALLLGMFVATLAATILLLVNQFTSPTAKTTAWFIIVIQGILAASFSYARFGPYRKPD